MALAVRPPVEPMLARLARALPTGPDLRYEPKWDGFRCLAFRDGDRIDLRSRNQRPLGRYFPEVVEAVGELAATEVVLDGELLVEVDGPDFSALMQRLHPAASRVERLRRETPARFVVFDVLAVGARDLRPEPFAARREVLETVVPAAGTLVVTPSTTDVETAEAWLDRPQASGIDGVVVRDAGAPYSPGKRTLTKVKREHTLDAVVAGFRWLPSGPELGSLLLGLHDAGGALHHVGVAASFAKARRRELLEAVAPHTTDLAGHPWEHGYGLEGGPLGRLMGAGGRWTPDLGLDWVPLRPELVCEVTYDHAERGRFRHPARFVRWRPDRDPATCSLAQLTPVAAA